MKKFLLGIFLGTALLAGGQILHSKTSNSCGIVNCQCGCQSGQNCSCDEQKGNPCGIQDCQCGCAQSGKCNCQKKCCDTPQVKKPIGKCS